MFNAIDSLNKQTYKEFEVIICGDHNSKADKEIIKLVIQNFPYLQIEYVENNQIPGISNTRNIGVSVAKGEWLVWLDSDDELHPTCLEKLYLATMNEKAEYIIGECKVLLENQIKVKSSKQAFDLHKRYKKTIYDPFMTSVTAIQPQIIRKTKFEEMGGFSLDYDKAELTEFFLRYLTRYPLHEMSFRCEAQYIYNKTIEDSVSKKRKELFYFRRKALLKYAKENCINIDDLVYYGREVSEDIPVYSPIKNGMLIMPPYRKELMFDFTETERLME